MLKTILILIATLILLPLLVLYVDPHPLSAIQWELLRNSFFAMLVVALSCFTLAELTKNCSQVDKIWSIVPIGYVWYFAYGSGWNERLVLMAVLVSLWGMRLTYNFSRRGAYKLKFWQGEEDYRWEALRQNETFKGKPLRWTLFNLFFISIYQNTLIWLFTLPALMAFSADASALAWSDYLLASLFVALLLFETIADQQQWNFQNEKHRRKKAAEALSGDYAAGFLRSGLWRYMRHPNYTAEQSIWIVFYFFSVIATGHWFNASMAGCLLLLILFQGSSDFSEKLSSEKYPEYKNYQADTSRFLPIPKGKKS